MFSRPALIFLGVLAVEVTMFVVLANSFGVLVPIVLGFLSSIAGYLILTRRLPKIVMDSVRSVKGKGNKPSVGEHAGIAAAGVLLLVPGIVSGGLGLVFLVPQVRRAVTGRMGPKFKAWFTPAESGFFGSFGRFRPGDVVDVDIADPGESSRSGDGNEGPFLMGPPGSDK